MSTNAPPCSYRYRRHHDRECIPLNGLAYISREGIYLNSMAYIPREGIPINSGIPAFSGITTLNPTQQPQRTTDQRATHLRSWCPRAVDIVWLSCIKGCIVPFPVLRIFVTGFSTSNVVFNGNAMPGDPQIAPIVAYCTPCECLPGGTPHVQPHIHGYGGPPMCQSMRSYTWSRMHIYIAWRHGNCKCQSYHASMGLTPPKYERIPTPLKPPLFEAERGIGWGIITN